MCNHSSLQRSGGLTSSLKKEQENASKGLLLQIPSHLPKNFEISKEYAFLEQTECSNTVHENLWEQARLNMNYGLYRVNNIKEDEKPDGNTKKFNVNAGDVFQIRGFDISNMTLVYDGVGWVIMDVLTTRQTAEAAWENIVIPYLTIENKTDKITTVIYSHSHADHYGGIGGLQKNFAEGCKIYAPEGFTEHAVSENIYVGAAMNRRAFYQYGTNLKTGVEGQVDGGLGKYVPRGETSILTPTDKIGFTSYDEGKNYCTVKSNELVMQIQFTPGTEAPAEMNVYLPEQKVLFIAENCAGTMHNALTPRGAQVRDLLAWANFLDETLVSFADMEIVCSAHNWPHFGAEDSKRFIEIQRDLYRYINNATLYLVNLGYTIDEVGRMISGEDGSMPVPKDFADDWCCLGFYGTFNHNAKAVYQRYLGWYDGNPAHLNRLKPADRAYKYIKEFGANTINKAAKKAFNNKEYAWAVELYDYIFNADEDSVKDVIDDARKGYIGALQQLGYQSEGASWRNMYLTGAQEIKDAELLPEIYLSFADSTIEAMSLEMILQYMGIMLDSKKVAKDNYKLSLNIQVEMMVEENGKFIKRYEYGIANTQRGILNYRILSEPVELAVNIIIRGEKSSFFKAFINGDLSKLPEILPENSADKKVLEEFIKNYLTRFPINFPIMTPKNKKVMNKISKTYNLQEIKNGYYIFWSLGTSCLYACDVKLIDDKGKVYFNYHKEDNGKTEMKPLGQGNEQFTGNKLTLEVVSYTTVTELQDSKNPCPVIDSTAKTVGYGYNICIEDKTDNDFNDIFITIMGWVGGK